MLSTWRKWNRILHRDFGYIAFGLTIIYAVSGFAVNHVSDWNPNYSKETITTQIESGNIPDRNLPDSVLAVIIMNRVSETGALKSSFRGSPDEIQFFVDGNTISFNFNSGIITEEKVKERFILYLFNFFHLNKAQKLWTIIADMYAVVLLFLAVSGLFMIKGKNGITGRGAWLTAAGIAIPFIFAWIYY